MLNVNYRRMVGKAVGSTSVIDMSGSEFFYEFNSWEWKYRSNRKRY